MATVIPSNHATFSLEELLEGTEGEILRRGESGAVEGVTIDSRRVEPGNLFVALRGSQVDGHEHISSAVRSGASVVLVSEPVTTSANVGVVRVPDTLTALGCIARLHRSRWARQVRRLGRTGRVVAITGSVGKTTTRTAIAALLDAHEPERVHQAAGNLNNAVGIPMVLLGLTQDHTYAVVEVGTNSPGEVAYGGSLVQPDVSVLTRISCAHTAGLGTIEQIAIEKGALLEATAREGAAIVNADDERISAQLERCRAQRRLSFGKHADADVRLTCQALDGIDEQRLDYDVKALRTSVRLRVKLMGDAGGYAIGAALSVGLALDVDIGGDGVRQAIEGLSAAEGRLRTQLLGSGVLLIDDSYNANPASMEDSLRHASLMARGLDRRLVLVLGEMRELGKESASEHDRVGRLAYESGAARMVAVGGAAQRMAERANSLGLPSTFVDDSSVALPEVLSLVTPKDVVLVKGSRGVALERIVAALSAQEGKESA